MQLVVEPSLGRSPFFWASWVLEIHLCYWCNNLRTRLIPFLPELLPHPDLLSRVRHHRPRALGFGCSKPSRSVAVPVGVRQNGVDISEM